MAATAHRHIHGHPHHLGVGHRAPWHLRPALGHHRHLHSLLRGHHTVCLRLWACGPGGRRSASLSRHPEVGDLLPPSNRRGRSNQQSGIMSQAASSCTARTRRSAPDMTGCVDPEAPIDEVSKLPLIKCPECKDRRVFPATTTKSEANRGKRYFKCPRQSYGRCKSYWFEEEYAAYLEDNGYVPPAAMPIEDPKVMGKIDSLEENLNKLNELVGKNRDGMASCICLFCGCVNVTLLLLLAIILVVAVLFK